MNLLIVDDEIIAIEGILDSVDWKLLSFNKVLTANSYSQALNLFVAERIDVLLCDVEMPYGSGIELVEWVKKHSPETECIFLTCHDEFQFTQRAIRLNCLDYILKPVPPEALVEVLKKARQVVEEKTKVRNYTNFGKSYVDNLNEVDNSSKELVTQVEQYINTHITEQFTVEDIARKYYISPNHLTKTFKKKHGKVIIDYIIEKRLFLAKELLETSDMTISMVSAKVGYADYSYFIRLFKKNFGTTPREYQLNFHQENK